MHATARPGSVCLGGVVMVLDKTPPLLLGPAKRGTNKHVCVSGVTLPKVRWEEVSWDGPRRFKPWLIDERPKAVFSKGVCPFASAQDPERLPVAHSLSPKGVAVTWLVFHGSG